MFCFVFIDVVAVVVVVVVVDDGFCPVFVVVSMVIVFYQRPEEKPPGGTRPRGLLLTLAGDESVVDRSPFTLEALLPFCEPTELFWWSEYPDPVTGLPSGLFARGESGLLLPVLAPLPKNDDPNWDWLWFLIRRGLVSSADPKMSLLPPPGGFNTLLELRLADIPWKVPVEVILIMIFR
jgi:hypothetical protein